MYSLLPSVSSIVRRHLNENKITKYDATNKDLIYLYVFV